MVKNHDVRVRVTKEQYQRIKINAYAKGFLSVSAFIRYLTLKDSLTVEMRVAETNRRVKHIEEMIADIYNKLNEIF